MTKYEEQAERCPADVGVKVALRYAQIVYKAMDRFRDECRFVLNVLFAGRRLHYQNTTVYEFLLGAAFKPRLTLLVLALEQCVPRWQLELTIPDMDLVYEYIEEE